MYTIGIGFVELSAEQNSVFLLNQPRRSVPVLHMDASEQIFEILVVDDNPADAVLLRHAWSECKEVRSHVTILQDSRTAVEYIRKSPRTDLVMLDYKHPWNGGAALAEIKSSQELAHVPVIVLSGSSNPRDYFDAYRKHANICFRKPIHADEFIDLVCHVAETWLMKAVRPNLPAA